MFTDSDNVRRLRLWWSLIAAILLLAGLAGGFFLPLGSPAADAPHSAPVVTSSGGPIGDDIARTTKQPPAEHAPATHEFALSTADVRDTQEAPALAVDAHGRICLAWASKTADDERSLFVAVSHDAGSSFSGPREIRKSGIFKSSSKGKSGGFERRMVPLMAAYGETTLLAWDEAPADGSTIRMMLAESHDGGQTFGEPICVHRSDAARPTFNSLAVNGQGEAVCGWLDSRHGAQQLFAAVRAAGDEQFGDEIQLYAGQQGAGVCPCCLTAAAVSDDGEVFVGFRNQLDGYRDTWLCLVPSSGAAIEPTPVTEPRWQFDGCPHDGPSMAICGGHLHVVWMDSHSGRPRVYYGRSPLGDLRFEAGPLHLAGPGSQGNARLCADEAGCLHAVWEASIDDDPPAKETGQKNGHAAHQHAPPMGAGRVIMYASSPRADGQFTPALAIAPRPKRFQTRPAIARGTRGVVVAWNELDESGKRVVVTRLSDVSPSLAPAEFEVHD
jgi:hypothetical protein